MLNINVLKILKQDFFGKIKKIIFRKQKGNDFIKKILFY